MHVFMNHYESVVSLALHEDLKETVGLSLFKGN